LPTTRLCCKLDVWALTQSRGDGHRSLITPERVLSEYHEDLIFFTTTNFYKQILEKILATLFPGATIEADRFINFQLGLVILFGKLVGFNSLFLSTLQLASIR